MEFSEWLYYKQFPMEDVTFHLKWAIDILLLMTPASDTPELAGEGGVCSGSQPGVGWACPLGPCWVLPPAEEPWDAIPEASRSPGWDLRGGQWFHF